MNIHAIKAFMQSDKFKGIIAIIAAVVMYFTPDHVDKIVELILTAFGINVLVIKAKHEPHSTNAESGLASSSDEEKKTASEGCPASRASGKCCAHMQKKDSA